ncbi:hypothetical protein TNCV_1511122 [Trichonephila clavipes]|nr:hypothetical protein TNCV_1511122 [Trichonephila clavipes]
MASVSGFGPLESYSRSAMWGLRRSTRFSNFADSSPLPITESQAESMLEPDEIGNVIEEVVDLSREINLEMDSSRTAGFPQSGADNEFIKMREQQQDIKEL